MRRVPLMLLCLPALGPSPAADAAAAPAIVRLAGCVPAAAAADRSATFEARARAVRGSARMELRFGLQVREDAARGWRRVVAPGLEEWLASDPGVRRYSFSRTVRNLSAPASYRTLVRFRWLDAGGEVLKAARVASAVCRQPDPRPDLSAGLLIAAPGPEPGTRRYAVTLRNGGRSPAAASTLALRVGERELDPLPVPGLAAGETRVLQLTGPDCAAGEPLTARADAGGAVEERDEEDNVLVVPCPAA